MARAEPKKKGKAKKASNRLTPSEQHSRFVEIADQIEADESPGAFDKAFESLRIRKYSIKKAPL